MRPFLYERLFHALLLELASGFYLEGHAFLSLRDMISRYHVSKPTATLAQELLERHRLVEISARSGCYVLSGAREKALLLLGKAPVITVPAPKSWRAKQQRLLEKPRESLHILVLFTVTSSEGLPTEGTGFLPEGLRSSTGCMEVAQHHGATVSFVLYDDTPSRQKAVLEFISSGQVSGLLIVEQRPASAQLDELIREAGRKGLPAVKTGSETLRSEIVHVDFNNVAAGYEAIGLFHAAGHQKVTLLSPSIQNTCFPLRQEGARQRAGEIGVELSAHELPPHEPGSALSCIFRRKPLPEALLCLGHDLADALTYLLQRRRLKPGRDLSLLTFSSSHTLSHSFTTDIMKMDFHARATAAAETLVQIILGHDVHRSTLIPMKYAAAPGGSSIRSKR